jgi:hypothetical protein
MSLREIEAKVVEWHNSDSPLPVHEYLGMTEDEYAIWVHTGHTYKGWYIDFGSDVFEGEIGPFETATAADEFARNLALQSRTASWTIVPLISPEDLL